VAVPPVRAVELERFEGTFNLARIGGAAITYLLGPFFPNIGIQHVALFGALLLGQSAFVAYLLRTGRLRRNPEPFARVIFAVDLVTISYAIFLFAYDPNWTTYIVGLLVVIAGGFRFASAGALAASLVMAAAYVAAAVYREREFGYATEPQRIAFTVTIYLLAGFLMAGLVRELDMLRAQREAFEHQRAETELLRTIDRMKSEFLAAMSHDFRSPLTVVRGGLELLLSERPGALTAAQRELALRAQRNVRRLEEFSEDLLEMARIEHGALALERTEVDACQLVRDVVEDHRPLAVDRRQSLELACGEPTIISADASRLGRAVGNLLTNAIKYAPEGSPIVVRAGRDGDEASFRVSVTDHGPGVARDERDRIFEKFSRGRRSTAVAGAGLGLSIARSLVELHGGTVRYDDAPDGGATFTIAVPVDIE
jgi:signal transduction histidine kinase